MFFSLLACSAPGPSFVALQGDSITVLEASSPLRNGILEMETEQGWEEQARKLEGQRWLLPGLTHGARLRLRDGKRGTASVMEPQALDLSIEGAEPPWLLPDESRSVEIDWKVPELLPMSRRKK